MKPNSPLASMYWILYMHVNGQVLHMLRNHQGKKPRQRQPSSSSYSSPLQFFSLQGHWMVVYHQQFAGTETL